MIEQLPTLPKLCSPDAPPDFRPTVVIDSREQTPLVFRRLPSVPGTLPTGDYSVAGLEHLFAVERKSVGDVVACCLGENRERFERELHRLRGFRFKRLLIVGAQVEVEQHGYRSNVSPKAILHSLAAFEARYDLPVIWEPDAETAAQRIETWAYWFAREIVQEANALCRGRSHPADREGIA